MGYKLTNTTERDLFIGVNFTGNEGEVGGDPRRLHLGPADVEDPSIEASPVKVVTDEYFERLLETNPRHLEKLTEEDLAKGVKPDLRVQDGVSDPDSGFYKVPDKYDQYKDSGGDIEADEEEKDAASKVMDRIS
jgi:hypothetical protein